MSKTSTKAFARKTALNELKNKGFAVTKDKHDFKFNEKRINIRGCNYNNSWAKKYNLVGGWDKLNPEKFDYFICVSFDENFKNVRYFIFIQDEVQKFPNTTFKGKVIGLKKCEIFRNNEESNRIIKNNENKWGKIV